jgi:hypothetical protein
MSGLLTADDLDRLLPAALLGAGETGVSEDEIHALFRWAEQVRLDSMLLDRLLKGDVRVNVAGADSPDSYRWANTDPAYRTRFEQQAADLRGTHGDDPRVRDSDRE